MAITVKAVLVANKREAQAEEKSDVFHFWLQVWLPINVPWSRAKSCTRQGSNSLCKQVKGMKPNENRKGLN